MNKLFSLLNHFKIIPVKDNLVINPGEFGKYDSRPFEWDRPGDDPRGTAYPNGALRIVQRDSEGAILACRKATDEEVQFIMLYELLEKHLMDKK